jgi:hypothetical protein
LAAPWDELSGPESSRRVRRRFGRPRQLDDWERVFLIPMNGDPGTGVWLLNGEMLNWSRRGDGLARAHITAILQHRNELIVELSDNVPFDGAILEIGCRAFIRNIRVQARRDDDRVVLLTAIDLASESADDPLELYALVNGETEGYLGPFSTNGLLTHEFHLNERRSLPRETAALRIDLICRSTIWDSYEMTVDLAEV